MMALERNEVSGPAATGCFRRIFGRSFPEKILAKYKNIQQINIHFSVSKLLAHSSPARHPPVNLSEEVRRRFSRQPSQWIQNMFPHSQTLKALALCLALSASSAFAQSPPPLEFAVWPGQAAKSPTYANANAASPLFDDRTLWPNVTGREAYVKQQWPAGRVMTWAKPGQSGGSRVRGLSPHDPSNWLLNGQPAAEVLFDENTDIVLPDSDTPYELNFRNDNWQEIYRHVTVGRNAALSGGGDGRGRTIHGNVWIREGGNLSAQGATRFAGASHTFLRNDSSARPEEKRRNYQMCSQYFQFQKAAEASVEFLGHVTVLDEFGGDSGVIIVGPDSWLQPGRNASPRLSNGAKLVLMDGARFSKWQNDFGTPCLNVTAGHISGGLPERPLTRPAQMMIHFKNHTDGRPPEGSIDPKALSRSIPRTVGLLLNAGSTVRSYSATPAGMLVFSSEPGFRMNSATLVVGSPGYEEAIARDPARKAGAEWLAGLPRGFDLWAAADVTVDRVGFDQLRAGGLMLENEKARGNFTNLVFGKNNAAAENALFSVQAPPDTRGGRY
jgi:hypothetical protein